MLTRQLIKELISEIRRDGQARERELKTNSFEWATLKFRRVPTKTYKHRWVSHFGMLKEIVVFYEDENDKWYVNMRSVWIPQISVLSVNAPGHKGLRSDALREAIAVLLNDQIQYFLDEMEHDALIQGPHNDHLYDPEVVAKVQPQLEIFREQLIELLIRSSHE